MKISNRLRAAVEAFKNPRLVGEGKFWLSTEDLLNIGEIACIRRDWGPTGTTTHLTVHQLPIEEREKLMHILG